MIAHQAASFVLRESHTLNELQSRLSGLDHWWRVWKTAIMLSAGDGDVDMEVVALYCLFHDSMRFTDGDDPHHGMRGFRLFERFEAVHDLSRIFHRHQRELLFESIVEHSNGQTTSDPTIAICWDADRLDLHRKALWPDTRFMSTQEGIALCPNRIRRHNRHI